MYRVNGKQREIAAEVASGAHQHSTTHKLDWRVVGKRSFELERRHLLAQRANMLVTANKFHLLDPATRRQQHKELRAARCLLKENCRHEILAIVYLTQEG